MFTRCFNKSVNQEFKERTVKKCVYKHLVRFAAFYYVPKLSTFSFIKVVVLESLSQRPVVA